MSQTPKARRGGAGKAFSAIKTNKYDDDCTIISESHPGCTCDCMGVVDGHALAPCECECEEECQCSGLWPHGCNPAQCLAAIAMFECTK